jgi:predicted nucleic acid-binding protein
MTFDCVVDASVGIKLLLVEPLSERADALFDHLTNSPPARFYVPDLFFIECTNVLWKYVNFYDYAPETAERDLADLTQLPLRVVPTAELAEDTLRLAVSQEIAAYDAAYLVLSQRLSLPLVTADETLVQRLGGTNLDVRLLADWP